MPNQPLRSKEQDNQKMYNNLLNLYFAVILDLQKSSTDNTVGPHIPCTQLPLMSVSYMTMVLYEN